MNELARMALLLCNQYEQRTHAMPTRIFANNIVLPHLRGVVSKAVCDGMKNRNGDHTARILVDQGKAGVRIEIEGLEGSWARTFDSPGEFAPGYIRQAITEAIFKRT